METSHKIRHVVRTSRRWTNMIQSNGRWQQLREQRQTEDQKPNKRLLERTFKIILNYIWWTNGTTSAADLPKPPSTCTCTVYPIRATRVHLYRRNCKPSSLFYEHVFGTFANEITRDVWSAPDSLDSCVNSCSSGAQTEKDYSLQSHWPCRRLWYVH